MIKEIQGIDNVTDDYYNLFDEQGIAFNYSLNRVAKYDLISLTITRNGRSFKRLLSPYSTIFRFEDFEVFTLSILKGCPRIYVSIKTPVVSSFKKVF